MRLPLAVLVLLAAGCTPPATGPGEGDDGTAGEPTSSETEHAPGVGPDIFAFPPVVARGGLMYLSSGAAITQISIEVDGLPLPVEYVLQTEVPTGLLRMPAEANVGRLALIARYRDDPEAATERTIEVVEPAFRDVAAPAGVAVQHNADGAPQDCAYSHTGVAFGDYDNDGAPDLFIGNVGSGGELYRNAGDRDGDGVPDFDDVTNAAGLAGTNAVAMANFVDLEGDGDLDLFVGRRGTNRVFENRLVPDGEAAFVDIAADVGLDAYDQRTMGVAFGDYDSDGDLDLYVVNHAYCFPTNGTEVRADDHLYRNDDGVFVERSEEMGGEVMASIGFSASWVDTDRDGDQDLIVINDDVGGMIGAPNGHWRNDGPSGDAGAWSFVDVSVESGVALPGVNGMGLGLGDVNGDGYVDLAFSNIGPNRLLLSNGDGTFADASAALGIERAQLPWEVGSITWASELFDLDNDGDLDLYFSGGRIKGQALIVDAMFVNHGGMNFEESTWYAGVADPASAKASALADFDRDGVWDLATTAWGAPFRLYHGQSRGNHWLDVQLRGRGGNREAVGAIVELTAGGRAQTCFHTNRPSLGAGGETHCHFGLGESSRIDALRITWPDGEAEDLQPPAVDQRLEVEH